MQKEKDMNKTGKTENGNTATGAKKAADKTTGDAKGAARGPVAREPMARELAAQEPTTRESTARIEAPLDATQSEAGIERYARAKERATKKAIAGTPMVPVWIDPVIGKDGEVLTYRLNGVTYHVKTKQIVEVPEALAMVIYDQARRKKLSARFMQEFITGYGKGMGELK